MIDTRRIVKYASQPSTRLRSWILLCLWVGAWSGCDTKGTYVLLRLERGAALVGDVASVDLQLSLGASTDTTTIRGKSGAALALPLTRALQIVDGVGRMTVTATARNAAGESLGTATEPVDVVKDDVAGLTLVLGGAPNPDLLGADLTGADFTAVPDLAPPADLFGADLSPAADLTSGLAPPVISISAPPMPYYELGSDGKTPYIWTITATQDGAPLPPVVYFDAATLEPNMIPATTGANTVTLTFLPTYRQAGTYSIKVIATSTAQTGSEASTFITIPVVNTMDPIGNFYVGEDNTLYNSPKSVGIQSIGDFNGDGFDDAVHVTRTRVKGTASDVLTTVRYYVLLGSEQGLALPPTDDSPVIEATHPRLRRFNLTTTQAATGFDYIANEATPPYYDTNYELVTGANLFAASAADQGNEIFYLDPTYRNPSGNQHQAQLFVVPSDAAPDTSAIALFEDAALIPGYGCGFECENPIIGGGDVDGDGDDDLFLYSYVIAGANKARSLRFVPHASGAPQQPDWKSLDAGGVFNVCTSSSAYRYSYSLGIGNVLPGAGLDFGLFGCVIEYGGYLTDFFSDGAAGFPNVARHHFYTPPRSESDTTAIFNQTLCDVSGDGRDDLVRLNTSVTPPEVEVYLNQAPTLLDAGAGASGGYSGDVFPVRASGDLDASKALTIKLPANAPGYGSWQWTRCIRHKGESTLFVTRGYAWEQARYEVLAITTDAAGTELLATPAPWSNGILKWPGDNFERQWFNRPRSGGDFNGDGKLDVITMASAPLQQTFWSVVYGR